MLYECLTGKPLFSGPSFANTLQQIMTKPIPRLSRERSDVEPDLEQAFERAIARNPSKRFQTVLELQEAVQKAVDVDAVAIKPEFAKWVQMLRKHREAIDSTMLSGDDTSKQMYTSDTTEVDNLSMTKKLS